MKTALKRILFCVLLSLVCINGFSLSAFDYLQESIVNIITSASVLQLVDYEYEERGALWGCLLQSGKTNSLRSEYQAGCEYIILAAADDITIDVDMNIYQGTSTGNLIAQDTAADGTPVVIFTPQTTGQYTFTITNNSYYDAFVSVVVLKYNEYAAFSFDPLMEALSNILSAAELVSYYTIKIPENKWILFGGNVYDKSDTSVFNINLNEGTYIFMASGDNSIYDVDVDVIKQDYVDYTGGTSIAIKETSTTNFDLAVFSNTGYEYNYLKAMNNWSYYGEGFVFAFLLQFF